MFQHSSSSPSTFQWLLTPTCRISDASGGDLSHSNMVIVCMFLPRLSGKDSVKLRGTNSHTWSVTGTAGCWSPLSERRRSKTVSIICCLWYPPVWPVWLLVSDGVGRHTTTMTAVGCRVEILTQVRWLLASFCCGDGQLKAYTSWVFPFTKGGGTPGLNLALEGWSLPPMS